jgi:hypothetical protein
MVKFVVFKYIEDQENERREKVLTVP